MYSHNLAIKNLGPNEYFSWLKKHEYQLAICNLYRIHSCYLKQT